MGETVSKYLKMDGDKAVPGAADTNEVVESPKNDHFGLLLNKACWTKILSYVEDPSDLHTVSNLGSPLLDEILKSRMASALFLLALPILMQNQDLALSRNWTSQSIMSCRQLNTVFQRTVDDCLASGTCNELFKPHVFSCSDLDEIVNLKCQAEWVKGSPFILGYLKLNVECKLELCELGLSLLQNHGQVLRRLTLINFLDNRMSEALSYCQNIEYLALFSGLSPRDPQGNSLELTLPSLPRLEHVWFQLYEHRRKQYKTVAPWARSFLLAYGLQLKTLHCDHSVFLSGIQWEVFSISLVNLEELQVNWLDLKSAPIFEILKQVNWLKLKRLYLNEWFGETVEFSKSTLETLDHFKDYLEELHLPKFSTQNLFTDENNDNMNENANIGRFPHLKRVSARESNVDSQIWTTFTTRFVNIECLRFEMDNRHDPYSPLILSKDRMKWFFSNFKKLQYILWPRQDSTSGVGQLYIAYMRNGKSYKVYENKTNPVIGY